MIGARAAFRTREVEDFNTTRACVPDELTLKKVVSSARGERQVAPPVVGDHSIAVHECTDRGDGVLGEIGDRKEDVISQVP